MLPTSQHGCIGKLYPLVHCSDMSIPDRIGVIHISRNFPVKACAPKQATHLEVPVALGVIEPLGVCDNEELWSGQPSACHWLCLYDVGPDLNPVESLGMAAGYRVEPGLSLFHQVHLTHPSIRHGVLRSFRLKSGVCAGNKNYQRMWDGRPEIKMYGSL